MAAGLRAQDKRQRNDDAGYRRAASATNHHRAVKIKAFRAFSAIEN